MNPRPVDGGVPYRSLKRSIRFRASVLDHLTERDIQICIDIFEHRFLTNHDIYQLHFTSEYRARTRTKQLYELGVLDRFRPPLHPGSWPWHYILDRVGAHVVSGVIDDVDPSRYFDLNRPERLLKSRRLEHSRDINAFFCQLAFEGRQCRIELSRWLGETSSSKLCYGITNPDGVGTLTAAESSADFFLELDRGSERAGQLGEKIFYYNEVAISRELPQILLFCFLTEARERSAREILNGSRLLTATSTLERHLSAPLRQNWLPLGKQRRLSILELSKECP